MYPEETVFFVGIIAGISGFLVGVGITTIHQYITIWSKEP